MNKLTKTYASVLTGLGCEIGSDGIVYLRPSPQDELEEIKVNIGGANKTLILPYKTILRSGLGDDFVAFHPACESMFSGQSEVLNTLTNLANLKLYKATQVAVITILQLAADREKHSKLRLAQRQLITEMPDVTQTALKYLVQIMNKSTGVSGKKPVLAMKLYRGNKIDGKKYGRSCRLLTPILDETDPIYDIKSSSKSQEAVRAAYEIVFPEVREVGSNSDGTPYLNSLLGMYYVAATHLNSLKEMLDKYSGEMELIDLSWYDDSKHIKKLGTQFIPQTLAGNTGVGSSDKEEPVVVKAPVAKLPIATGSTAPQRQESIAVAPQDVPVVTRGAVVRDAPSPQQVPVRNSLAERMAADRGMNVPMAPGGYQQYQQQYQPQQQQYQQQYQPQQQQYQQQQYQQQPQGYQPQQQPVYQQQQPPQQRVMTRGDVSSGNAGYYR